VPATTPVLRTRVRCIASNPTPSWPTKDPLSTSGLTDRGAPGEQYVTDPLCCYAPCLFANVATLYPVSPLASCIHLSHIRPSVRPILPTVQSLRENGIGEGGALDPRLHRSSPDTCSSSALMAVIKMVAPADQRSAWSKYTPRRSLDCGFLSSCGSVTALLLVR
jgi:hypothetical protein